MIVQHKKTNRVAGNIAFYACMALIIGMSFTKKPDTNRAEVNNVQGIFIFTDSRPVAEYQYLGTVTTKGLLSFNPQYNNMRDAMIKKVKQQYPGADGIIFYFNSGSADKADAIKLKQ